MNIYYADGDQQVGPVDKAELQSLIKAKKLNARTLVWQAGMEDWQELGVFIRSQKSSQATDQAAVPVKQAACSECGLSFAEDEMIPFQDTRICAGCKPLFVQKIKEGVSVAGAMNYAGFWIRFGAIVIDGFILWAVNFLLFIPLGILLPTSEDNPYVFLSFMPFLIYGYIESPSDKNN